MSETVDKSQLLDRIRRARAEWEALITPMDDTHMLQAGFCDDWSAKDVVAHLTWHEREMIKVLQAHALVGSDLWNLPLDQRNQAIYAENKDRSLQEVREEAQQVFPLLMQWLETLTEEDLHDASRFPDMPLEWEPWQVLASNTYEHYQDHIPQLRAWLRSAS